MATTIINASNIENFLKTIPSSTNDIRDIDNVIDSGGDLSVILGVDVIIKSLTRLLMINNRSYLFNPDFGVGLPRYIFEPADIVTQNAIITAVKTEISKYETRAQIIPSLVFTQNYQGFILTLQVTYRGNTKTASLQVDKNLLKTINNFQTNTTNNNTLRKV